MITKFTIGPSGQRVIDRTEKAALNVRRRFDDAMSELADRCVEGVKKRIDLQLFVPLKEGYLVRKRAAGLNVEILKATKRYYDGIQKRRVGLADYNVMADEDIARWMEDGSETRPPRPHWAPTLQEMERLAPQIVADKVSMDLP